MKGRPKPVFPILKCLLWLTGFSGIIWGLGVFSNDVSRALEDGAWLFAFCPLYFIPKLKLFSAPPTTPEGPPLDAEFLFYLFLDARECDALVGDLEERYKLIRNKFGRSRASFWYWTQAIRSVGPIAWAGGRKVALKPVAALVTWAVAKNLLGSNSWLATLLQLYRRIVR